MYYSKEIYIDSDRKLTKLFINIYTLFFFLALQLDYFLTYMGVIKLKVAAEANPITEIFLNIDQSKAIIIRILLTLTIVVVINIRLKYLLKSNNIKGVTSYIYVLSALIFIIYTLHTIWIIGFITQY